MKFSSLIGKADVADAIICTAPDRGGALECAHKGAGNRFGRFGGEATWNSAKPQSRYLVFEPLPLTTSQSGMEMFLPTQAPNAFQTGELFFTPEVRPAPGRRYSRCHCC